MGEVLMRQTYEVVVGAVFVKEVLQAAYRQMKELEEQQAFDLTGGGLVLGSTRPNGEGYFAVFNADGFFLGPLNFAWGTTYDGRLDAIATPDWLLDLAGTEYEDEARALSYRLARASEPDKLGARSIWSDIAELREKALA